SGDDNALRELEEETRFIGERATCLGNTYTDSGLTDSMVSFYHVPIIRRAKQSHEAGEAIRAVQLVSRAELLRRIQSGEIRDGFTVQALALYDHAGLG
ncbi:MAG: NUDIX hydrolase, partial [Longimicrobiales bacterium]